MKTIEAPAGGAVEVTERPFLPVKVWALVGTTSTVLVASIWIRWLTSDEVIAAPKGPDEFNAAKELFIRGVEVASVVAALYMVWRLLLRPVLRERVLTFDGMLVVSCLLVWVYDPLMNYFNFSFNYNAYFFNRGAWVNFIPGWSAPNLNRMPQPLLFIGGAYIWYVVGCALLGCFVLRRLKTRFPTMGRGAMFATLALSIAVLEAGLEIVFLRTEIWTFPAAPRSITLFAGTRYQLPLVGPLLAGVFAAGMTYFRYYRDDRGRTICERGVDALGLSPVRRRAVSLMAVTGFVHLWIFVSFYVPWTMVALKSDTSPPDLPSYMRSGICGKGTDYACPDKLVPIPKRGSLHLVPDDPRLPRR